MRTVIPLAFLAFITVFVSAQSTSPETSETNLYSVALNATILQVEKNGHIDDSSSGVRMDYRHMVIEQASSIIEGLSTEFENPFRRVP